MFCSVLIFYFQVHYEIPEEMDVASYVNKCLTKAFSQWKYELHKYYQLFPSADEALAHPPSELASRLNEWQWLCTHFQSPNFLVLLLFIILLLL